MNIEQMTEQLQSFIMAALQKAQTNRNSELSVEHVLCAMLESDALDGIFERMNVSKDEMRRIAEEYMKKLPSVQGSGDPVLSRSLSQGYQNALGIMKQFNDSYMSSGVLLAGIMQTDAAAVKEMKKRGNFDENKVISAEKERRGGVTMDEKGNESQLDALEKY